MRNHPCLYCKRRRRKCIYLRGSNDCMMCTQMHTDCTPCKSEEAHPMHDGNQQLQQWQQQINKLNIDLISMREPMSQHLLWDLRIVDGNIYVESRIRSLRELIEYNQASIRYLSPFQHFFCKEHIRFKGVSTSIALASTGLIVRHAAPSTVSRHTISYQPQDTTRKVMNRLIILYMERYNAFVGFIHAESFFQFYNDLDDPLSSALALAICVDCIAYFYTQLEYSTQEKRDFAEFFYIRCRDMILDMFDDPKRRLEAVLSTNLLMQYLVDMLLEYTEARRLITIALLACHELDSQELSLIEDAMFQRSRVGLHIAMACINLVVDDKFDFSCISLRNIHVFSDEPQTIHTYVTMWEHILGLVGSRYITTLFERVRYSVLRGHACELSLDLVLQFEPTVQVWWKNLSSEFRLCDDPFDVKAACQAIKNVTSSTHLMPLAMVHVITAMIQSALLQPYTTVADQGTMDIVNILRERALNLTLCCTQGLIHIMKKNLEVDIEAIPLSFGYMMGVLHSVCNIVSCMRVQLPPEMQSMLIYCFTQLKSTVPSDHHVPESVTKLESFVTTCESNPIVVYEKYPMPKLALLSDIFETCFRQLNSVVYTP